MAQITANANGELKGKFTIPQGVPAGVKSVEFTGSGGSYGSATFTGQGTLTTETRRTVTTITKVTGYTDPLAQTFVLDNLTQIGGVDIYLTALGTSPIEVQIRNVENGVPNKEVIASKRIAPAALQIEAYNRFAFEKPVLLEAETEYAIVVLCNDATSACGVAELGQWDKVGAQWIAAQPYQVGVLLSSSNASTWTSHQTKDLAFRLLACNYATLAKTVDLGECYVSEITDFCLMALSETPSAACRVQYKLQFFKELTPATADLAATYETEPSLTYTVAEEQAVKLDSHFTGKITAQVVLTGESKLSPIYFPGTYLLTAQIQPKALYVSRAINAGQNVKVKVVFLANTPAGSSVRCYVKGEGENNFDWQAFTNATSENDDDGFVEITQSLENLTADMVRVKLELQGTPAARPQVKNLRVMVV